MLGIGGPTLLDAAQLFLTFAPDQQEEICQSCSLEQLIGLLYVPIRRQNRFKAAAGGGGENKVEPVRAYCVEMAGAKQNRAQARREEILASYREARKNWSLEKAKQTEAAKKDGE